MGMGLNKNRIRNLSLGLLVVVSFFLSFSLWTAGRDIDEEENSGSKTSSSSVSLVTHGESDVFRPTEVALHGTDSSDSILLGRTYALRNFLETRFETKNLHRIENSETFDYEDYLNRLEIGEWVEFIYREEQPFELIADKFSDLSQDLNEDFYDRVLVDVNEPDAVYFYHTATRTLYTASVLENEKVDVKPFLNQENIDYINAEATTLANNIVYLPEDSQKIPYKSYVIDKLPSSTYIGNFFPDTSLVDVRSTDDFTRYIDLTKEVTINQENYTLTYLRQIDDGGELSTAERYTRSFEQVNRFENWSDTFVLSDYDHEKQVVSFQREIEGTPVFSSSGDESISEVSLVESGVTHMKLPLRFISTPITIDASTKELISGESLLQRVESSLDEEDFEKVEDFALGYTWQESEEESEVIYFNPDWYILYNGEWIEVDSFLKSHEEAAYGL